MAIEGKADKYALYELIGYTLRRDIYHCSRQELMEMSHTDVMLDWGIHQVLREAEDREAKKAEKRYNKRTYGGHF